MLRLIQRRKTDRESWDWALFSRQVAKTPQNVPKNLHMATLFRTQHQMAILLVLLWLSIKSTKCDVVMSIVMLWCYQKSWKGWDKEPSIKDIRTKSRQIDPSFLVRSGSTPHKFRKIRSFCIKKCGRPQLKKPLVRKMSALDNLPPPRLRPSFMDSP